MKISSKAAHNNLQRSFLVVFLLLSSSMSTLAIQEAKYSLQTPKNQKWGKVTKEPTGDQKQEKIKKEGISDTPQDPLQGSLVAGLGGSSITSPIQAMTTFDYKNQKETISWPMPANSTAKDVTMLLDLSSTSLVYPYLGFPTDQQVTCSKANNCKINATKTSIRYGDAVCDGFSAQGVLKLSPEVPKTANETTIKPANFDLLAVGKGYKTCPLTTGVLGLGLGSKFMGYLNSSFLSILKDQPIVLSYSTVLESNGSARIKNGRVGINDRKSKLGCSSIQNFSSFEAKNKPFRYAEDENGDDSSVESTFNAPYHSWEAKILFEGQTEKKSDFEFSDFNGDKGLIISGSDGLSTYFAVRNSQKLIEKINQKICGKSTCGASESETDIKKGPVITIKLNCVPKLDLISQMKLVINPEDYIKIIDKKVVYLIRELDADAPPTVGMSLDRLFFSKYEFFTRIAYDVETERLITSGFGDMNYHVDKVYWITVAAVVAAGLVLTSVLLVLIFGRKELKEAREGDQDESGDDFRQGEDDEEFDDVDVSGNSPYYTSGLIQSNMT